MQKKIVIPIALDRTLVMKVILFDQEEEIDLDKLLKVDVSNIGMELATFPIILNKIGLLVADANSRVNLSKFDCEIYEAQLAEKLRSKYQEENDGKQMSNEKVKEATIRDVKYQIKQKLYFTRIKEYEYLNSIYWSAKSKNDYIQKLANTIQAGDVEESIINSKLRKFNYIDTTILRTKTV